MKRLIVTFVLLVSISIVATDFKTNQKQENPRIPSCEMFSIHDLEIKDGVDVKEFEKLVMEEIAPLYNQMKGQRLFLVKGYVGWRKDQYAILITFDSLDDRNRIYPHDIGFSEEFKKIMEGKEIMWQKFRSMADGFDGKAEHTDYILVYP